MTRETYRLLEDRMQRFAEDDAAHDSEHIYRVLNMALQIASQETGVNYDVLIASCLLHDIGRRDQRLNPELDHAEAGAVRAFSILTEIGWPETAAAHVRDCIATHRFRSSCPPVSIEARILFDADKLDVCGLLGIARTISYEAQLGTPLYTVDANGLVMDGDGDCQPSFFHEYHRKLCKLYDRFYTDYARQTAKRYEQDARIFYHALLDQVRQLRETGTEILQSYLQ